MKKILLLTTGGTIASIQTDNGLVPGLDGNQLIEFIPRLKNMCHIDVKAVFNLDSTNVYYKHWLMLVKVIKEEYNKGNIAFAISFLSLDLKYKNEYGGYVGEGKYKISENRKATESYTCWKNILKSKVEIYY